MNNYVKLQDRGIKYAVDKFGFRKRLYRVRTDTKRYKELKRKIDKANKQIIEARELCRVERIKLNLWKIKEFELKKKRHAYYLDKKAEKLRVSELVQGGLK